MAKYTGLKRSIITVPARGTASFDFTTNQPNYFRVQNRGIIRIYGSTGSMPTQNNYDFYVDGEKVKLYTQPYSSNRLYIYNPGESDITVVCVSFYAEFDPLTYAMSDIEVTVPEFVNNETTIKGFSSPLPTGSNTIGKVVISGSIPTGPNKIGSVGISDPIPAGNNKIGSVSVDNLTTLATLAKQNEMLTKIESIVSSLSNLLIDKNKYVDDTASFSATNQSSDTAICNGGGCFIHLLTNDGDADINIVLTGTSGTQTFTLKAGETIQDFKFIGSIKVTGTNYSFRTLVSYTF